MTKKQLKEKEIQDYLDHEPEYLVLTVDEFKERFNDFDHQKYDLIVGHTIMWEDHVVTLRTPKGKLEITKSYETT